MRRPPTVDLVLAALLLAFGELGAVSGETSLPRAAVVALTALYCVPLAFRRVYPLPAVALSLATLIVLGIFETDNEQPTIPLAIGLACFTLGESVPWPASGIGVVVTVAAFSAALVATDVPVADLVFLGMFAVGAWLVGRIARRHRETAREASERADVAVEAERRRLARELHDVVSHSISVIAVQAQAIRRRLGPEHAREIEDLEAVETTARQAMAEMRRLLGVLRADGEDAPLAPQPGLGELPQLLEQSRAAGLDVRLELEGSAVPLPPGVDLTAYRIVQEALTNVVKHAGATTAHVRIRYAARDLELCIDDDGHGRAPAANGGHGLLGMRERVTLYGGHVSAGPRPEGGFRVNAGLPIREAG